MVSVLDVAGLAPGNMVHCVLHHSDGTEEKLQLNHSFGEAQIEWFRVGSALNLFHKNA